MNIKKAVLSIILVLLLFTVTIFSAWAERSVPDTMRDTPPTFAILEEDANWGKMRPTWGTDNDFAELNRYMDKIKVMLVDQGTLSQAFFHECV